jgi:hypothetical protein
MPVQIRSDLDLPTLRILLDPARTDFTQAVFQLVRGRDMPYEVARCSIHDLGLPEALAGMRPVMDETLRVPPEVLARLQTFLPRVGPSPMRPENALWLEFPSPRGCLYVMPWERLLAPLGRSLFRLPNYVVRPQAPGRNLEVAICASTPLAKGLFPADLIVGTLADQYLRYTGHDVTLHIFTDSAVPLPAVQAGAPGQVIVYDPAGAASYERPRRTAGVGVSARLSSPWLLWMRDALQGRPLDVVHFVGHGYLSGDRGAFAVATTPTVNTDEQMARFIGAAEINAFLSQVGAWGLVLTGPPMNFSEPGLRALADAVAKVRPGIAMTHDASRDTSGEEFGLCLRTVVAQEGTLDRPLPSVTCWVHPAFVEFPYWDQADLHLNADGSSAFIGPATVDALSGRGTEAWVASATRALEIQQARWLPDSPEQPADPAAVTALRNVADLVERHVGRAYPGDSGGGRL